MPGATRLRVRFSVLFFLGWSIFGTDSIAAGPALQGNVRGFLENHCLDCHEGEDAEAGLDLSSLGADLSDPGVQQRWVRIHDRVRAGEMPPPEMGALDADEVSDFSEHVAQELRAHDLDDQQRRGRVRARRLTRLQIERTLQALLGVDIPLIDLLPEESTRHRYSTLAVGQAMSHFHLESYLAAVDHALDEAFRRALSQPDHYQRDFDARGLARKNPRRRCREPEMRDGQAVVWNGGVIFYGRLPATTAPADGWYRFRATISALKQPASGGVWTTVRSGLCVSSAPLLLPVATVEAEQAPKTVEFTAWLPKGHMIEIRPADATLKKARFQGGQIGTGEGEPQDVPGIALDQLTMERFHDVADDEVRRRLFGELLVNVGDNAQVRTDAPEADAERLLLAFARRAFRRPAESPELQPYVDAVITAHREGMPFHHALRLGYRSLLCSPRFLYFSETPGELDAHALAARLSYFLTGCSPDSDLSALADSGELLDAETWQAETERLLSHDGGQRFVRDFAAEWLDLNKMQASTPDRKRYGEFDPVVEQSMQDETHAYLETLLHDDESVVQLLDSDFTYLNSRLARFYEIPNVVGDALRRVQLPQESSRGGLLTHGSILKVTANGSNTSPVVRGVWIAERLLGVHVPPPPENVPAIEPDIRGAVTMREQLAKHRADDACAACHAKFDPAGFALENFDPVGQWRRVYRPKKGKRPALPVDASYELPDGRHFEDVREFRELVAAEPRKLAANVAEQLLVYGTGESIRFADRDVVESIVDTAEEHEFGFRSLVHAVVASSIFRQK